MIRRPHAAHELLPPHDEPMPRAVRACVDAMIARIPDEPEQAVHRDITVELRSILRADTASSMLPLFVPELGWTVEYAHIFPSPGPTTNAKASMDAALAGVGLHELSPVFPLRDDVTNQPLYCSVETLAEWGAYRYRDVSAKLDVAGPQIGVAFADRGTTLGYIGFGSFTDEFAPWSATALRAVIPALRARLAVDLRIREARVLAAALEAALDLVEVPAFVLLATAHLVHANALGRLWRDRDPQGLREAIDASIAGAADAPLAIDRRRVPGMPDVVVAVQRRARSRALLERFAHDHRLTRREIEVLEQIAAGHSNKTIASNLTCTVKNVEQFVSSLFARPAAPRGPSSSPACTTSVEETAAPELPNRSAYPSWAPVPRIGQEICAPSSSRRSPRSRSVQAPTAPRSACGARRSRRSTPRSSCRCSSSRSRRARSDRARCSRCCCGRGSRSPRPRSASCSRSRSPPRSRRGHERARRRRAIERRERRLGHEHKRRRRRRHDDDERLRVPRGGLPRHGQHWRGGPRAARGARAGTPPPLPARMTAHLDGVGEPRPRRDSHARVMDRFRSRPAPIRSTSASSSRASASGRRSRIADGFVSPRIARVSRVEASGRPLCASGRAVAFSRARARSSRE
ncbi:MULTISPECIES: LuxR C-terminal-related transcriptional regulator [Sandaracinus]|uniref:LuxR C-terminal-related transcriptional regulator n=1 Tax=Sandaracinus TaxID=1055688 RepID=UPI0019D4E880|nr:MULTISPECIES: LuxR C-terminal-related transcriptional regulator [Sandaracinus]UJR87367.1 Hypothetical protein I5071_1590 [Sandaracinus amylolyticus]